MDNVVVCDGIVLMSSMGLCCGRQQDSVGVAVGRLVLLLAALV